MRPSSLPLCANAKTPKARPPTKTPKPHANPAPAPNPALLAEAIAEPAEANHASLAPRTQTRATAEKPLQSKLINFLISLSLRGGCCENEPDWFYL
ncbi:hypothetical protein SBV1_240016 [Verrucomicrobia bacterium]|nr:hypothetical protein SBV1_240016 [Verrucomicrobiota bacterium]